MSSPFEKIFGHPHPKRHTAYGSLPGKYGGTQMRAAAKRTIPVIRYRMRSSFRAPSPRS